MEPKEEVECAEAFLKEEYDQELYEHRNEESYFLSIDFQKLTISNPEFADLLLTEPEGIIRTFELAVENMLRKDWTIGFFNLPELLRLKIEDMRTHHLGQLVRVEGIISSKSTPYSIISSSEFECPSCGNAVSILQDWKKIKEPIRCHCGRHGRFRLIKHTYSDVMEITLAECAEDATLYEIKIKIPNIFLGKEFAPLLRGGNTIIVTGILTPLLGNAKGAVNVVEKTIIANNLQLVKEAANHEISDVDKLLSAMNPYQFEEYTARLFMKRGYTTKTTPKTGDKGIDVIATKGMEKIGIQCKLNKRDVKVSNSVIQKALGASLSPFKATKVIVITTADEFTGSAIEQAKGAQLPIELWNRDKLIAEIKAYMQGTEEGWDLLNELEEKEYKTPLFYEEDAEMDVDAISTGISSSQMHRKIVIREILRGLVGKFGRDVPMEEIIAVAKEKKIDEAQVEESLERLKRAGEIFEPKPGYICFL